MKTNQKRMTVKSIAVLTAVIMIIGMLPMIAFANKPVALSADLKTLEEVRAEYGAITVEAYNLGKGFLVEPSLYAKDNRSAGEITVDFLESKGVSYSGSTSYFSGFEFDDSVEAEFPEYLTEYSESGEIYSTNSDPDGILAEFDYSNYAGWCFTINDWWSSYGASNAYPGQEITDYNTQEKVVLGDVIRWHFTVYGYGADCGFPGNVMADYMGGNLFTQEEKSNLIFILAAINDYYGNLGVDNVYETALAVAANPLATAEEIAEQEEFLTSYIDETFIKESEESATDPIKEAIEAIGLRLGIINNDKTVVIVPTSTDGVAVKADELKEKFDDSTVIITSNNGIVGTGSKITIGETEMEIVVKGDLDGDGVSTVFDALMVKKALAENGFENEALREFAGDVDGVEGTSNEDVNGILSHIVGNSNIE